MKVLNLLSRLAAPLFLPIAVLLVLPSLTPLKPSRAVAQNNKPAAEFQSLLNMRYYEGNGGTR